MILGFKEQFKDKILSGSKIHTIREDKRNRWGDGWQNMFCKIHMATDVRTSNYECFKVTQLIGVQSFVLRYDESKCIKYIAIDQTLYWDSKFHGFDSWQIKTLIKNDGFDSLGEFLKFFNKDFEGKIIHWTDFKY